jgi:hypothetical protein
VARLPPGRFLAVAALLDRSPSPNACENSKRRSDYDLCPVSVKRLIDRLFRGDAIQGRHF